VSARSQLGEALLTLGDSSGALEHLLRAVQDAQSGEIAPALLGMARLRLARAQDRRTARETVRQALSELPAGSDTEPIRKELQSLVARR
jgi:tetratricopeptide (TPR) repeat protein